jgi:hypothetical protein
MKEIQWFRRKSLKRVRCLRHSTPDAFNSLLIVPRIQPSGTLEYFSLTSCFLLYIIIFPSLSPFLQTCSRNSSWPSNVSQSHLLVCCQLKDSIEIIVINTDINHILQFHLYEPTHTSSSPTTLPQK